MRKLSLLLAIIMMIGMVGVPAMAENTAPTEAELLAQNCEFAVIEADGAQPRLTYIEGLTNIIEADGLKFKDMNGNGTLDVYEDYRQDIDARIADLLSQMTLEEKVGLLFCVNTSLDDARHLIEEFKMTCQLFNLNGTPITITNTLNNLQAKAESMRLSVPMVFTSDREYNSFGGYIDKSHEGFGTAYDPDLAYKLAYFYGQAMRAVGIHVTFEPYANEIGAQYGENPELIAAIIAQEVKGLEDSGFASCTKHWIGRGGDSSFGNARSVAQNFDNWMVGWKAALNAGAEWVMTNCGGTGITNTVDVKYDAITMGYLRDTLGFNGVVVTDWWPMGFNNSKVSGVNPDGVELSEQSIAWLYNEALKNGTDMFGTGSISRGTDVGTKYMCHYPDVMMEGVQSGEVKEEYIDRAATRILNFKFVKGLFENPYCDVDAAVKFCASAEWAANPTEIHTNEDLRAARNPEEVALTEELQAKSAVLVKNDDNLLPLQKGVKVYVEATSADVKAGYKKYLAEYTTVVEDIADCDIAIGDFSKIDDVAELFFEDAHDMGKKVVVSLNNTDPTQYTIENSDALLYLSYNHRADHGSTEAGFITTTEPWIYAKLIFGDLQPGGVIVKEIARDTASDAEQWKDLAGDQGASPYVRLMVQATMEDDTENHASPNNWGDPLVQALYGMSYNEAPEFKYSCLILPTQITQQEGTDSRGRATVVTTAANVAKVGQPCTLYCLLRNNGGDGITTVQVTENDKVIAEKIMTVCGGSWRVVQMDVVFDTIGEHTVSVGGLTGTLSVVK